MNVSSLLQFLLIRLRSSIENVYRDIKEPELLLAIEEVNRFNEQTMGKQVDTLSLLLSNYFCFTDISIEFKRLENFVDLVIECYYSEIE